MPQLQKIVCALDLSEHSKVVAEYATMLAKMSGASIVAVYAAPTLTQYTGFHVPPNTIDSFVGEIVSGAEKAMTTFVAEHFGDVPVKAEVVVGYAAEEILALAENEKADLIVMGTHGRKGIDRILFGSVAEKVVKNSALPVLTIRPVTDEGDVGAARRPRSEPRFGFDPNRFPGNGFCSAGKRLFFLPAGGKRLQPGR